MLITLRSRGSLLKTLMSLGFRTVIVDVCIELSSSYSSNNHILATTKEIDDEFGGQ